jgi:membrane protein implicated in regulation of membrane protease activity
MLRTVVLRLFVGVALVAALAITAVVLGFALLIVPLAMFAVAWFARHKLRRQRRGEPAVYEGEFQVLEEIPDRPA